MVAPGESSWSLATAASPVTSTDTTVRRTASGFGGLGAPFAIAASQSGIMRSASAPSRTEYIARICGWKARWATAVSLMRTPSK